MTIDSHQHVFWHGKNHHELVADMDEQRIDQAWLLTWEIPPSDFNPSYSGVLNPAHVRPDGTHPGIPLSDLLFTRDHYPERFLIGYCPDPAKTNAPALLESAVKIHGVKVCGEWKFRMLIDDPRCIEMFHVAGALKLPVVLHLGVPWLNGRYQNEWYGGTVENLERALIECPDTQFIGHAPGFWQEISASASASDKYPEGTIDAPGRLHQLFDTYPNLHADLSAQSGLRALKRDPAHARDFVNRYSDRLLFGRDFYGSELVDFLGTLELADAVAQKIYAGNALRLMNPK